MSLLTSHRNILFIKTNVAAWDDVLGAFEAGFRRFSSIDAVISNAGINSGETLLEFEVDEQNQLLPPPKLDSLNINLIAHMYVVRCAMYYFKKSKTRVGHIILTTSAAAFLDTPPLYVYSTAKAGLLGLLRSLRTAVIKENVTINAVAPWMTRMYTFYYSSGQMMLNFCSVSNGTSHPCGSLGRPACKLR